MVFYVVVVMLICTASLIHATFYNEWTNPKREREKEQSQEIIRSSMTSYGLKWQSRQLRNNNRLNFPLICSPELCYCLYACACGDLAGKGLFKNEEARGQQKQQNKKQQLCG
jgi:hypothetical protein